MSFTLLALVVLVGLLGPLLASRQSWHIPGVVGELLGGLLIGASGLHLIDSGEQTFTLLATIGFGLVMFVVGSNVPIRDVAVRAGFARGILGAAVVGVVAALLGAVIASAFSTNHAALYAVVIASSSAALILPVIASLRLARVTQLTAQIAVADAACIIALPLAIDPSRAIAASVGSVAVIGSAVVLFFVLRTLDRRGIRSRIHHLSERRKFALELRINLLVLFALAALAQLTHVSVLLAGFSLGLVIAAIGEPRRLSRQLFGITEGFFGPLFFVWLGASISLADLGTHPLMILLGVCLAASAIIAHLSARLLGQPLLFGVMAAGQLGVPIAAVTLGTQLRVLGPGEAAALLLGALLTVVSTTVAGAIRARQSGALIA